MTLYHLAYRVVAGAAVVGIGGTAGVRAPGVRSDACEAKVMTQAPLATADGEAVSIDASVMSRSGDRILILGTPAWLFRARGADSILGVMRDADGAVRIVSRPPVNEVVSYPRATPSPSGGWDVVFVTGKEGDDGPLTFRTATVWHASYDGQWRGVERVATVSAARFRYGIASELVRSRDGLRFAFVADEPASGAVMLRQDGTKWRSDTLHTWQSPRSVQLVPTRDGRQIVAALVQTYFRPGRIFPPTLFAARYGASWSTPVRVAGDTSFAVGNINLTTLGDGFVATWQRVGRQETTTMAATFDANGRMSPSVDVATVAEMDRDAIAPLGTHGRAAIFTRPDGSRTSMAVHVLANGKRMSAGTIAVPFDNFTPLAIGVDSTNVLLLTGALSLQSVTAPAASYLTRVAVVCRLERR